MVGVVAEEPLQDDARVWTWRCPPCSRRTSMASASGVHRSRQPSTSSNVVSRASASSCALGMASSSSQPMLEAASVNGVVSAPGSPITAQIQ